jgi:glycerol-3-phosphate dehydrogenase
MTKLLEFGERTFDLIIIGGGIVGAGIARDAALRGLQVVLFEKHDFGSGTTAGSTRLIHGGLRYLEMLDFRLVRLDLKERETLLRIAPHLVKPLEFLVPFYHRSFLYRWKMRAGMILYDLLSFDKSLPRHRFLSAEEVKASEPQLQDEGLQGAAAYYDAQANSPERLCLENLLEAREHGAILCNYAEVTGAVRTGQAITGVRVKDALNTGGPEVEVKGRVVVNASGPWFDRVAGKLTATKSQQIRTTKGIHFTSPPLHQRALVLFSKIDGRLFFAIPWLGYSWIGTTDTDFSDDPGQARATTADVDYTFESVRQFLPAIDYDQIFFSNAGVRALVMEEGSESSVSRMHRIANGAQEGIPGLISVLGGKLTGYRAIAEEATDAVCQILGTRQSCRTADLPLPGARQASSIVVTAPLSQETVDHLHRLYGARAVEVLRLASTDEQLGAKLSPSYPDIAAQVIFAVREEQCVRLSDFIWRRTLLGFSHDQGLSAVPNITDLMAGEMDWSPTRKTAELTNYKRLRDQTQEFRRQGVPTNAKKKDMMTA